MTARGKITDPVEKAGSQPDGQPTHDVFLCHNSEDKDEVKKIGRALERHGLRPWFDEWELRPGLPWQRTLEEQIEKIGAAAVFVGKSGIGPWQSVELDGFLREFVGRSCPVIPVLLTSCGGKPKLPVFLKGMTWVDFRKEDPDPIARLIWGITGELPRQEPEEDGDRSGKTAKEDAPEIVRYRAWAGERYGKVDLVGVGAGDVRLRLEEIYVPVRMGWRAERELHGEAGALGAEAGEENLELDRIIPTLGKLRRRCAVLLGHPGAGKTTALRKLAQECLKDPQSLGLERDTVPVFLPLRWLRSKDLRKSFETHLGHYLAEVSKDELPEDLGKKLWRRGRLLLLLDGLDEVAEDRRRTELLSWLDWQLGRSQAKTMQAIVTSRFAGYEAAEGPANELVTFEIRPLEGHQVDQLVRLWFQEAQRSIPDYPEDEARQRAEDLVTALRSEEYSSQRLKVLVSSPLLLTLLCVIVLRGGEMPRERVAFYEQCLRVLLGSWGEVTKGKKPLLGIEAALSILRPLAWKLHFEKRRDDLSTVELISHLRKRLQALDQKVSAFAVLDWLYRETGVLAEYAPDRYGFMHLGLQEYLAAAHAASRGEELLDTVAAAFGERWWREVVLLLAALPGQGALRTLLEKVVAGPALVERADLLRECLSEAAEVDVEPIVRILREGTDPTRQAAALRILQGRCDDGILESADKLTASGWREVAALAGRLLETCREDRTERAVLDVDLVLVWDPAEEEGARRLESLLEGRGLRLVSGDWPSRLAEVLENTRAAAVLVGGAGRAPWEDRDVEALLELLEAEHRALVPVVLPDGPEPGKLPEEYSWLSWVDLRQGFDQGCEALERALLEHEARAAKEAVAATEPVGGERWREPRTGMEFLWVPGGRFEMGEGELAHPVRVSPFWLAVTPVTNRQYGLFLEETKHEEPGFWRDGRFSDPEQPVVGVSWHEAMRFCEWLSGESGREIKLPSEAQWEFAARGEEGRRYPWGKEKPDETRAFFGRNLRTGKPEVVGSFPEGRGPFGHLDLAGTVWEWCLDVWNEKAYASRAGQETVDPVVTGGEKQIRVLRGGGWAYPAEYLRAAIRYGNPASFRGVNVGFRVLAVPASLGS